MALDVEDGLVIAREDRSAEVAEFRNDRTDDDDNAFERMLKKIRLRFADND